MANTKSAQKQARQNKVRRAVNVARKSAIKTMIKKMVSEIENDTLDTAKETFKQVQAKLARAKGKRVIHSNTASRKISRLAQQIARAENSSK